MKPVTLWYFSYCMNSLGVYDRVWAASRSGLEKKRRELKELYRGEMDDRITENTTGEYGEHGPACEVEVIPTARGILAFASEYAVDDY